MAMIVKLGNSDLVAIVDDEDAKLVLEYKWSARVLHHTTYAFTNIVLPTSKRTILFMHNLIMGYIGVDHIDRNGLNNRKSNMRSATKAQNNMNRGVHGDNTSGFKGVAFSKRDKKWRARIQLKYRTIYLGVFTSKEGAALAYDKAAKELFGEFAVLNFPGGGLK